MASNSGDSSSGLEYILDILINALYYIVLLFINIGILLYNVVLYLIFSLTSKDGKKEPNYASFFRWNRYTKKKRSSSYKGSYVGKKKIDYKEYNAEFMEKSDK